jgi:RNA recognition motif-containing protein
MTVTMAGERGVNKRLYVGNLFPDVTDEDLKSKFNRFDILIWHAVRYVERNSQWSGS